MGAGIGFGVVPADTRIEIAGLPAVHSLEPADWERAERRLREYLAAMGIGDPLECERLCQRVRVRVEVRALVAALEDPVEAAIEEVCGLLDQWLTTELDLQGETDAIYAARAAVLGGTVPGWSARWADFAETSLAAPIRAASVAPVPETAPLGMEPGKIELGFQRLGRRLRGLGRRLRARLRRIAADPAPITHGSLGDHP